MKDPVNDSSMHVAELARFATLHCDSVIQSGASLDCPYRGRPPQPWRKKNLESIRCIGQQLNLQVLWNALLYYSSGEASTSKCFPISQRCHVAAF